MNETSSNGIILCFACPISSGRQSIFFAQNILYSVNNCFMDIEMNSTKINIETSSRYSPCTEDFYISIKSSILHPTSSILHPTSSILHPTSSILHPTSSIHHKKSIQSNPIQSYPILSYPIQQNYLDHISRNQNTMLTSDSIINSLGHLCNKYRVYTN